MSSEWLTAMVSRGDQASLTLLWVTGVCTAVAVVAGTSRWWRRGGQGTRGKVGARKGLAQSPGIRVIRVKSDSSTSTSSSDSNAGWGVGSSLFGGGGGGKESSTKWERSKQKGEMGYYFAHHTSMKELAPEDYRMNGPRLLSKSPTAPQNGKTADVPKVPASSPTPTPRRRAQMITSYAWEDYGEEVRLTFRQSGWDWSKVYEEEVGAEWGPRRFRLSIDSREYGLHTIDLPRLSGEVGDVKVLKLRSRLVVALVKGGRGSYSRKTPWTELQSKSAPPNGS